MHLNGGYKIDGNVYFLLVGVFVRYLFDQSSFFLSSTSSPVSLTVNDSTTSTSTSNGVTSTNKNNLIFFVVCDSAVPLTGPRSVSLSRIWSQKLS